MKRTPATKVIRRPAALTRPRGGLLHWRRAPLLRAHLIYLIGCTAYCIGLHPAALGPILLLALTGIIGELAPANLRRYFVAEALLLVSGIASFWWTWDLDHHGLDEAAEVVLDPSQLVVFQGWIRMVFVVWLLIPSRPGYLRWFAALAGVELALTSGDPATHATLNLLILVPGAVIALAWDAHLRVATIRGEDVQVGRAAPASLMRWNGGLIAVVCIIALIGGGLIQHRTKPMLPSDGNGARLPLPQRNVQFRGINQHMHLGENSYSDRNPTLSAQLTAERPLTPDTYYLRALTLPYLELNGGRVSWRASRQANRLLPPMPTLHRGHDPEMVTVYRRADAQDVILIPDGASDVELMDVVADPDGNLYRPGIGDIHTRYATDLGATVRPDMHWNRVDDGRFRRLDDELADRLRRYLPEVDLWRQMLPQDAAHTIARFLKSRCTYQLRNLPEPGDNIGSNILTFLFDEDPARRVGHCQYFATAGVLLLRAAGHDARCVVGYASDEVEEATVTFRGLNAHAWLEVRIRQDDKLYWQRVDPTPPSFLSERRGGLNAADLDAEKERLQKQARDANQDNDKRRQWRQIAYWLGSALALIGAALGVWWLNRKHAESPRERALNRQSEQLLSFAVRLGLQVDAHTTLTALTQAIEARTGVSLETHRRAHLAARFGDGPMPPAWPLAELRAAMATKETRMVTSVTEA
ncbi:MAG: transglutaminase-like domain-containing protein [Planctomycetota bacterium]|jgi:transglutaminase-like putative cysteine protease|nr:transglutaminase-like domain-containing protein [Planctomycetota bacterium]